MTGWQFDIKWLSTKVRLSCDWPWCRHFPAVWSWGNALTCLGPTHAFWHRTERVTGRKARGPQAAGGNKLQVADVFSPFVLMKLVLPKTTIFFLFSNLGLIIGQQTSTHINCFMARDDTPRAIPSQKCILWERGLVRRPQPWGVSFTWLEAC